MFLTLLPAQHVKQDIPEQKLVLVNDASILDVASVECVWSIQVEMFRKGFEIQS